MLCIPVCTEAFSVSVTARTAPDAGLEVGADAEAGTGTGAGAGAGTGTVGAGLGRGLGAGAGAGAGAADGAGAVSARYRTPRQQGRSKGHSYGASHCSPLTL